MISLTLTLLAVLTTVVPSSALAGSLLSGYGGPGEGNQVILGSALLGGGAGGSSSGSSRLDGSSATGAAGVGVQAGVGNAALSGSSGRGPMARGRAAAGTSGSRGTSGDASGDAARAYPVVSRGNTTGAMEALGLSGEDLGYVLLTLGALALIGVVTRRLARATRPEGVWWLKRGDVKPE